MNPITITLTKIRTKRRIDKPGGDFGIPFDLGQWVFFGV
jgi:hypothetical protein